MKCDAVFEGGGVKGLAFVGAIQETERRGYTFHQLAGTSAGSIIASLLAAGYTGQEIEEIMMEVCFDKLLKLNWFGKIPIIGKGANVLFFNGIYSSEKLEGWMTQKLKQKKVTYFGDLPRGKLRIIASDITNGRIMVIPDDLPQYGLSADDFPIAKAVRMSSSIPYFFQPYILYHKRQKMYIVDGGLLSNYPIWLFDSEGVPKWPTFGYRLRGAEKESSPHVMGPITMIHALVSTMLEAHDRKYIELQHASRTIFLPVENIQGTAFDITNEQKKRLIELGREEARQFFDRWNFYHYINQFRRKNKTYVGEKTKKESIPS